MNRQLANILRSLIYSSLEQNPYTLADDEWDKVLSYAYKLGQEWK